MIQDLKWDNVRAFVLVARHGSLSKAARAGGTTQPTLGRQIQALEAELGVTLFDRATTGLKPTATGTALLEHADAMATAADRLGLAASGQAEAVAGTVRITASEVMATYVLPPILAALRREEPEIEIELVAANDSRNLLQREADIAVRMYRPTQSNVITRHVVEVPVAAYASPDYLLRRGDPASVHDMAGHDLVGHDRDEQIIRGFRQAGLELTRDAFSLRCDDHVTCWEFVRAGWGIGFMLRCVGDVDSAVVAMFDGNTVNVLPVWLTAHAELRTNARVRRVYDHLGRHLRGLRSSDQGAKGARPDRRSAAKPSSARKNPTEQAQPERPSERQGVIPP